VSYFVDGPQIVANEPGIPFDGMVQHDALLLHKGKAAPDTMKHAPHLLT
jgi:hypothetical protein